MQISSPWITNEDFHADGLGNHAISGIPETIGFNLIGKV